MPFELNTQFRHALSTLENTSKHIFLTGKAGTGKSTLLQYFRSHTLKNLAVVAPTGVAAVNIAGETLHGFFKFPIGITQEEASKKGKSQHKNKLYTELETLIIDEISMVRADLLDCVDVFLRSARESFFPFGGVQIVMIGDLYQLPPVLTRDEKEAFANLYPSPHFFSSHVIHEILSDYPEDLAFIELQKIYRQSDQDFIDLLNGIRTKAIKPEHFKLLHSRYQADLDTNRYPAHIILTTTNAIADEINDSNINSLQERPLIFSATKSGEFEPKAFPTPETLILKKYARVMFLNNDPEDRWINGTLGTITDFEIVEHKDQEVTAVTVKIDDGPAFNVTPHTWTAYKTTFNEDERKLETVPMGSYTQIPLKPAWAVTIHKSQGKTFDRVIIDIGNGAFATGQIYVALSRATTLAGIILKKPIRHYDIRVDLKVTQFLQAIASRTISN